MLINEKERSIAILGASDGLTSTVAVVIGQLLVGSHKSLLVGGLSISLAAGIGMGWSQWLGDATKSTRAAVIMGVATFATSFLPVVPYLFLWKLPGVVVSGFVFVGLAAMIAILRARSPEIPDDSRRAAATTFGGIVVVSAIVTVPSVIAH